MKIYLFSVYQLIVFFSAQQLAIGKALFTGDTKQSDIGAYVPALRHAEKSSMYHSSNARDIEEDDEQMPSLNLKLPKINVQGTQCYDIASSKRAIEDDLPASRFAFKHKNRRSPYIVYNQGKPIGILEPISRIYEYQDFNAQHNHDESESKSPLSTIKRETDSINDVKDATATANIASDTKYASLLTNFKIGNRVKVKQLGEDAPYEEKSSFEEKEQKKREVQTQPPALAAGKTETTLKTKRDISEANLDVLETNLKTIMSDLGLIGEDNVVKREIGEENFVKPETAEDNFAKQEVAEDDIVKRDIGEDKIAKQEVGEDNIAKLEIGKDNVAKQEAGADILKREIGEDEDLDVGLNKIGISKELHAVERNKKENCPGKTGPTNTGDAKNLRKGIEASLPGEEATVEGDFQSKKAKKARIADFRFEGESFVRKKRQQKTPDNGDIIKGLEASGELTVSGNKSPLASSETENKHKSPKADKDEKRDKEDQEYDKRLQRNIQNKISQIKAEVKREISQMNTGAATKKTEDNKRAIVPNSNDKKKRDEKQGKKETKTRKKRTLMDKETKSIQPNTKLDGGLEPHVRKRRHIDADEPEDKQNDKSRITWSEVKDEKLAKRENSEPKKIQHDPSAYEFEYRKKRSSEKSDKLNNATQPDESKKREEAENKKREASANTKNTGGENNSGFRDVQNQNVANVAEGPTHALVTRELGTKSASAASMGKAKLKNSPMSEHVTLSRLVSDSASLTDSLKTDRGARSGPEQSHVEVELHTTKEENVPTKREKVDEDEKAVESQEMSKLAPDSKTPIGVTNTDFSINDEAKKKRSVKMYTEHEDHDENEPHDDKIKTDKSAKLQDNVKAAADTIESKVSEENVKDINKEDTKLVDLTNKLGDETRDAATHEDASKLSDESTDNKITDSASDTQKRSSNEAVYKSLKKNAQLAPASEEYKDSKKESNNVRMERKSEPNLSLEDMQQIDSENANKRKRRQAEFYNYYGREKRDFQQPNNMRFRNYRGDEDEADDESDEFDDDNFDDRTANFIRKRAADQTDASNYDFDEDYEPMADKSENHPHGRINKRNTLLHKYVADMNSDLYSSPNYLYDNQIRKKRQVMEDVAAIHSGGPMLRHLAAAKERNLQPMDANFRRKRLEKMTQKQNRDQTIAGLSESDIFGGLPQSYEGELSRFKRVKRGEAPENDT